MILSTHALVGAAISSKIQNPIIFIPLVLAVHYLLDGLRHGEYFDDRIVKIKDVWWKVLIDLSIAALIILYFIYLNRFDIKLILNILLGSFFSMLPDLFTVFFYWKPNLKIFIKIKNFGSLMHRYNKNPKYSPERQWTLRNAINDILFSVISIIILFV